MLKLDGMTLEGAAARAGVSVGALKVQGASRIQGVEEDRWRS